MDKSRRFIVPGFSLIEILLAMMIVAVMASQVPRLTSLQRTKQTKLLGNLNSLAQDAYTYSLMSGKVTQFFFEFGHDATPKKVSIRQEIPPKKNSDQKTGFETISSEFVTNSFDWDQQFSVERFIIDGKNEAGGAGDLKTVWFYIMPGGLAQQVMLSLRNTETQELIELQLNPFFVQFKEL